MSLSVSVSESERVIDFESEIQRVCELVNV